MQVLNNTQSVCVFIRHTSTKRVDLNVSSHRTHTCPRKILIFNWMENTKTKNATVRKTISSSASRFLYDFYKTGTKNYMKQINENELFLLITSPAAQACYLPACKLDLAERRSRSPGGATFHSSY